MASIKKVVSGPFTARLEAQPGVTFMVGDKVIAEVALSQLNADIQQRLAVHGLSQKIGDSYAGASAEEDPMRAALSAISETIDQLVKGEWRVTAAAGGPRATLLARALARATGHTLEEAISVITEREDALSEDDFKAWAKALRADAAIKAATLAIKEEDLAKQKAKGVGEKKTDLGSLFA